MRHFPLHNLDHIEFENLVLLICAKILGEGVIPFAKGPDGGRDGKFIGKANCFPSEVAPWNGQIVIQAKHTSKENASCSDTAFNIILENEVLPAIERLKKEAKIDFYILFTNRKLSGKQDEKIENILNTRTDIPNIVIAEEKIQQWLQTYPKLVKEAKLQKLLWPLQFDESDLKTLILEFRKLNLEPINRSNRLADFTYTSMEQKNELNQLGKAYFEEVIKRDYVYSLDIKKFLNDPINSSLKDLYNDTIHEINTKIVLHRNQYTTFEDLLDEYYNYVVANNTELSGKKMLIRVFLNFMYCNCDIGRKDA